MKLPPMGMKEDRRGQMAMVGVAIGMIVTLMIGIIVTNALFISNAGPTQSDNENAVGYGTADAVAAFTSTKNYAWIAIGLMALGIVILGAVTILSFIRPLMGGGRKGA